MWFRFDTLFQDKCNVAPTSSNIELLRQGTFDGETQINVEGVRLNL